MSHSLSHEKKNYTLICSPCSE